MEKHEIVVPKGIRYIGETDENGKRIWSDYDIANYQEPHILNKTLTGCGFTEYCISCPHSIVLISPRRFLLKNKFDQHPRDVYYFQNNDEVSIDYELDVNDDKKGIQQKAEKMEEGKNVTLKNLDDLKSAFRATIRAHRMCTPYKPLKILVTYDSFKHVKDCLQHLYYDESDHKAGYENILDRFQIVVDEFQSIFIDARFKSDAEIELLDALKDIKKVCYVSATPYLDKYLEMLDEFKDLPYYELDWEKEDPERTIKPSLDVKFTTRSLNDEAKGVIDSYKKGKFETRLDKEGNLIESREAVIFMNSVKAICQVIKTNRLHIDQVNVICADTFKNENSVRKAFNDVLKKETEDLEKHPRVPKDYNVIGSIPLKGQPHKMFTLCTRTDYLGADFYSTNARTFIFSDSNIACLSVDIGVDLEQILGRQRLDINPWKNTAFMYVRTTDKKHKQTKEEFEKYIDEKDRNSINLLSGYEKCNEDEKRPLANNFRTIAKMCHYKNDYISVTEIRNWSTGQIVKLIPKYNKLMKISELRAFEIQQVDYKDRFTVFNAIGKSKVEGATIESCKLADEFLNLGDTSKKLRMLVEAKSRKGITEKDFNLFLEIIPPKFKEYYTVMGPDFIRANKYQEADIRREWKKLKANEEIECNIISGIYNTFETGKRYSKSKIKSELADLYKKLGYQKTAKATDLEEYYVLKGVKFDDGSGKFVHGFELIGKR